MSAGGDTLKGAAGGAGLGTSIMPGVGTAIGAGVGGLLGYLGSNDDAADEKAKRDAYYEQIRNRQAPQAGAAAQSGLSGFRNNQQDLISRLEALSKGQGPSLAAEQMRAATDRNQAAQASMANSGRGGGMAAINAANNMGRLGAQSAQDSMMGRIQEQQMALGQLGGAIGQGRGQDEANSQFNALQTNYRDQANLQAKLQTMGYNDAQIRSIMEMNQAQANQPTVGDQLMSGGAGALSMWASNQNKAPGGQGGMPGYPQWGNYQGPGNPSPGPVTQPNTGFMGNPNIPDRNR